MSQAHCHFCPVSTEKLGQAPSPNFIPLPQDQGAQRLTAHWWAQVRQGRERVRQQDSFEPVCPEPTPDPLPAAAWASSHCLQWYQAGGHGHMVLNLLSWAVLWWVGTGSHTHRCDREGGTLSVCQQAPVWPCTLNSPQSLQRVAGLGCPDRERLGPSQPSG